MAHSILIVDDDATVRTALRRMLENESYRTHEAASGDEALAVLDGHVVDLVITDVSMPGMSGLELLEILQKRDRSPQAIVISGEGTIAVAVQAVQLGALDFVEKPVRPERLIVSVRNALRYADLAEAHAELQAELGAGRRLVGSSPTMKRLEGLIARVAASDGRVLIVGENGTGKELVAEAIHEGSPRREGPFVKLNCAAVPESLVESELFGHEKGAFTGAVAARKGRFELADGGTLFLDEIGDMPAAMQSKLLRVLQEGKLERVGGGRTLSVDVRVIAATNRDLAAMVDSGAFREDLYYRLAVVTIPTPPLRERMEDVPALVRHFAAALGARGHHRSLTFRADAIEALQRHAFPGNVRELQNVVERIAILVDRDEVTPDDVLDAVPALRTRKGGTELYRPQKALKDLVADAERQIILEAIAAHDGNKSAAARALEMERSHFYRKCHKHGID